MVTSSLLLKIELEQYYFVPKFRMIIPIFYKIYLFFVTFPIGIASRLTDSRLSPGQTRNQKVLRRNKLVRQLPDSNRISPVKNILLYIIS